MELAVRALVSELGLTPNDTGHRIMGDYLTLIVSGNEITVQ